MFHIPREVESWEESNHLRPNYLTCVAHVIYAWMYRQIVTSFTYESHHSRRSRLNYQVDISLYHIEAIAEREETLTRTRPLHSITLGK